MYQTTVWFDEHIANSSKNMFEPVQKWKCNDQQIPNPPSPSLPAFNCPQQSLKTSIVWSCESHDSLENTPSLVKAMNHQYMEEKNATKSGAPLLNWQTVEDIHKASKLFQLFLLNNALSMPEILVPAWPSYRTPVIQHHSKTQSAKICATVEMSILKTSHSSTASPYLSRIEWKHHQTRRRYLHKKTSSSWSVFSPSFTTKPASSEVWNFAKSFVMISRQHDDRKDCTEDVCEGQNGDPAAKMYPSGGRGRRAAPLGGGGWSRGGPVQRYLPAEAQPTGDGQRDLAPVGTPRHRDPRKGQDGRLHSSSQNGLSQNIHIYIHIIYIYNVCIIGGIPASNHPSPINPASLWHHRRWVNFARPSTR